MALAIGIVWAQKRLKGRKIFTSSPGKINLAGSVDLALFDKTGTLTKDGLQFAGFQAENSDKVLDFEGVNEIAKIGMIGCHSLMQVENGEIIGDPLELEVFKKSSGKLELISDSNAMKLSSGKVSIIQEKTFPFEHDLKRQSSLISRGENRFIFCKGAPEVIFELCKEDLHSKKELVKKLSEKGLRIIGMAYREVHKNDDVDQESLEKDLGYLGLMIFSNDLKNESTKIIAELEGANIPTAMITGDNLDTAVAVGKHCGILNEKMLIIPVTVLEFAIEKLFPK